MADNVNITEGSGKVISADDLGGVLVQRVKVQYGSDGSATDVDTGTPLPVTVVANTLATGAATSAKQDTGNTSVASIDTKTPALGQALAAASVPVVLTAAQLTTITPPAAITGFATSAKQDTGNTSLSSIDGKITAVNTGAVVVSSSALPTGAATAAKQPALGTAGVASTDVITVQGIASGTAQPVSGTVTANAGSGTMAVSIATAPVLVAGSAVIGKVGIDQTTPGTTNLVALAANQSVNQAQVNGVTVSTGNGVSGTGVQRVTMASDSTGQVTLAAGAATIGALTANQSVNNAQIGGVAVSTSNGVVGTGVQRVAIASDNTAFSVNSTDTGNVANGVTDSGNPVKIGGKATSTPSAVTTGQRVDALFDLMGRLSVFQKSQTATLTNVASSATNVTLLAANVTRIGAQIYNDSTQVCYVKFGVTASNTSFTVPLATNTYYEVPGGYQGQIDAIWVSANGNARVTELT